MAAINRLAALAYQEHIDRHLLATLPQPVCCVDCGRPQIDWVGGTSGACPHCEITAVGEYPQPRRVLIVEDEPSIAASTKRLVKRIDPTVDVMTVSTAELAITYLRGCAVTLVVSDYQLAARLNGGDVCAFVKANCPGTRFMFVSSDERMAAHGVPCFEKPVSLTVLRQAIEAELKEVVL